MWRYLAGSAATIALMAIGFFLIKSMAEPQNVVPPPPAQVDAEPGEEASQPVLPPKRAKGLELAAPMHFVNSGPPTATEFSKEEKRFNRYDKDKNGAINKTEYMINRRRAFDRLDTNEDGIVSFSEYSLKGVKKFAGADLNRDGILNRREFSTTRVIRKPRKKCPKIQAPAAAEPAEAEG